MPIEKPKGLEPVVAAPPRPHLGLLTNEFGSLATLPIKPGSVMMIIMDPKDTKKAAATAIVPAKGAVETVPAAPPAPFDVDPPTPAAPPASN